MSKSVQLLYGRDGMELVLPDSAQVLEGRHPEPVANVAEAIDQALRRPIGSEGLAELVRARKPRSVAITISDITRPVPNRMFLPAILNVLNASGVSDARIVIIVGTGLHRRSTAAEHAELVGPEVLARVVDHDATDPAGLIELGQDPPVRVNRRFAQADFRIVTGFIEPHFMAGFSGGRKGVCPALVDLETVQRFHGYRTLSDERARLGQIEGNPCHQIALEVARRVGVDFLFNVAVNRHRQIEGIFCGDLEQAHAEGCRRVAEWTTAAVDRPFDLVVSCGGGYPLDLTFYQAVKGMVGALPAVGEGGTLLLAAQCQEGLGSEPYRKLLHQYRHDWRGFLRAAAEAAPRTQLDQWEFQMHARVLERTGIDRLWFASDGLSPQDQQAVAVRALEGPGDARARTQAAIDAFLAERPTARVAVIPEGPYTQVQVLD